MIRISLKTLIWLLVVTEVNVQSVESSGDDESLVTTIPPEENPNGNRQPGKVVGKNITRQGSQEKSLVNLVLVDLLCQQLVRQSEACLENKVRLDNWVARETTSPIPLLPSPTPMMVPQPPVTNHSSLPLPNIGLREKWKSFFRTVAKVIPLIGTVKDTGFEKLKTFLQTTPIAVSDLLTSLGLSSASRLQELNNIASRLKVKIDAVVGKIETVETSLIVSTTVSLILFMIGAALWIGNNFAAWRRSREERRNFRRDRRASRMLLSLQRARYNQAQQQVVVV